MVSFNGFKRQQAVATNDDIKRLRTELARLREEVCWLLVFVAFGVGMLLLESMGCGGAP